MADFASGLAAGSAVVNNAVDAYSRMQGALYTGQVQQDDLEKMAAAKQDRDFYLGMRAQMAAAAQNGGTRAGVTPSDTAPTTSTGDGATYQEQGPMSGADVAADQSAPDTTGLNAMAGVATQPASTVATNQADQQSQIPAPDTRPLWQKQVDAYTAAHNYALANGRPDVAAEMNHNVVQTRTMAAQQQAQTGLRQFIGSGYTDPSGLVSAFNTVDDGVKATGISTNPDGTFTVNLVGQNGQPVSTTPISKDQLPQLVNQYFDPSAAYARQQQVLADRSTKQFDSNLKIGEKAAEQRGAMMTTKPDITQIDQGPGLPKAAVIVQPTDNGWSVNPVGATAPGQIAPVRSDADVAMHKDIESTGFQGLTGTAVPAMPADINAAHSNVAIAQGLYDANKDNPSIGALNPERWLTVAKAIQSGTAKPVDMVDKNGIHKPAVVLNGTIYATDAIPANSPANANRDPNVPAVMPSPRSPYTRTDVPAAPSAVAAPGAARAPSSAAAAFNADSTVAAVSTPAAVATAQNDRVAILGQELTDAQARVAAATTAADKNRAQGDVQAVTNELKRVGGTIAAARAQPVVVPGPVASPVASPASAVVPPAAGSARSAPVSNAVPIPTDIPAATARLKELNSTISQQSSQVVNGTRAAVDPGLAAERDVLTRGLAAANQTSAASARAAASRAAMRYSPEYAASRSF